MQAGKLALVSHAVWAMGASHRMQQLCAQALQQGGTAAAGLVLQRHLRGALGCLAAAAWPARLSCFRVWAALWQQRAEAAVSTIQQCADVLLAHRCQHGSGTPLYAGYVTIKCTVVGAWLLCKGRPCASLLGGLSCDLMPIIRLQHLLKAGLLKPLLAAAVANSHLCQYSSSLPIQQHT